MNISYIFKLYSVKKIMFLVILSCIPGFLTELYFFGWGILIQVCLFIFFSLFLEFVILKIRSKSIKDNLLDNSSIITSLLIGLSISPILPWWMILFGSFFSIVVSKHLYGGLGQNIFNPAMIGYVVLLISFPLNINCWNEKKNTFSFLNSINKYYFSLSSQKKPFDNNINNYPENFTEATPLNDFKIKSHINYSSSENIIKTKKTIISKDWIYINISFLLGGVFLLYKKIICWRIPFSFLTILTIFSSMSYFLSKNFFITPLLYIFSGGTMICAFFIATDPVTTAATNIGKIVFGVIIGLLVWVIRSYSDYPDGIAFAVLFANMCVPLINYFFHTSGYGHKNT